MGNVQEQRRNLARLAATLAIPFALTGCSGESPSGLNDGPVPSVTIIPRSADLQPQGKTILPRPTEASQNYLQILKTAIDALRTEVYSEKDSKTADKEIRSEIALWDSLYAVWNRLGTTDRMQTLVRTLNRSSNKGFTDAMLRAREHDILFVVQNKIEDLNGQNLSIRRAKVANPTMISFRIEFSRSALLSGEYADPIVLTSELAYQTQVIKNLMSDPRVLRAASPTEKSKALNEVESDPQAFAIIKGDGNAVTAKAFLMHLALLGKTRADPAQRELERTLIAFILCGQANNQCFRDTIGLTR